MRIGWTEVLTFWNVLLKCAISNCVYALHGNYKIGIQTALQCRIRAAHVAIVCISVHKYDYIFGMGIPLTDRAPIRHLKWEG